MALGAQLPSWLNQPNFLGAMEAGASTGLRARQQDIEEYQAADRLKLAYDQLAKQERVASMQALAKQKQGEAALALRAAIAQQGMDLRERSLQQQGELRSRELDQQQKNQDAMLKLRTSEDQTKQGQANRKINPDGTVTIFDPETQTTKIVGTPKVAPRKGKTNAELYRDEQSNVLTSHLKNLQNKLTTTSPNTDQFNQLQNEMAQTSFQLRKLYSPQQAPNQEYVPDTSKVAPAPAKGKFRFDTKSGQIVPVDAQPDSGDDEEE